MGRCNKCKHYNGGHGTYPCVFCDPPFENRYEPKGDEDMTESEAIIQFKERLNISDYKEQIPEYYEAMEIAINALEKQIPKKPTFQYNLSDTVSVFECDCGKTIKVRHDAGVMANNDAPKFCDNCGKKFNWESE